jgi:hypothetical protein
METYFFNKQVVIDSVYFKNQNKGQLQAFPKHMVIDDQGITFESGLQQLVREGKRVFKLFYMTDGHAKYQLKFDPEAGAWNLLRVVSGV